MFLRNLSIVAPMLLPSLCVWAAPQTLCEIDPPAALYWHEAKSFLSYSTPYSFLFESIPPQATQVALSVEAGFDDDHVEPRALRLNLEWAGHTSLFGPFNVVDLDFFTKTHARIANGGIENLETSQMRQTKHLESLDRYAEQHVNELSKAISRRLSQKSPEAWARARDAVRSALLNLNPNQMTQEIKSHWFAKRLLNYQKIMQLNLMTGGFGFSASDTATADFIAVAVMAPVSFGGAQLENFPKFAAGVSDEGHVQWALSLPYWSQIVAAMATPNDEMPSTQVDLGFLPITKALLKDKIAYAAERNMIPSSEEVALLTKKMMAFKDSDLSATRRRLRYKLTVQIENCTGDNDLRLKARGRFLGEFFKSDYSTPLTIQENSRILRLVNDATGVPTERIIEAHFGPDAVLTSGRPNVMQSTLAGANEILQVLKKQFDAGALPVKDGDGKELLTISPDDESFFENINNAPFAPVVGPPDPELSESTWSRFLQSFHPEQIIDSLNSNGRASQ